MKQYVESDPNMRIYICHSIGLCNGHRSHPEIYTAHVYVYDRIVSIIFFRSTTYRIFLRDASDYVEGSSINISDLPFNRYVPQSTGEIDDKRIFGVSEFWIRF